MHKLLLFAATMASALLGCSEKALPPSDIIHAFTKEDALRLMNTAKVSCRDSKSCPEAVGLFVSIDGINLTEVHQCSTFLVAPDMVATNAHCVPQLLRSAKASCVGRGKIYFPRTATKPALSIGCEEIVSSATYIDESTFTAAPDFAFLRLSAPVNREFFSIDQLGIEDKEELLLYKVNPLSPVVVAGEVEATRCTALHGSYILPASAYSQSPVLALADCSIIHGNSGSPLLSGGKVKGIVQITLTNAMPVYFKAFQVNDGARFVGIGSNFGCIEVPGMASHPLPDECSPHVLRTILTAHASELIMQNHKIQGSEPDQLALEFAQWILNDDGQQNFNWQRGWQDIDRKSGLAFMIPYCVQKAAFGNGLFESDDFPVLRGEVGINKYLQPFNDVGKVLGVKLSVTYDVAQLISKGETSLNLRIKNSAGAVLASKSNTLTVCP